MAIDELTMVGQVEPEPDTQQPSEARAVSSLYSLVRLRPVGQSRYPWVGRVLEVGMKHLRFELFGTAPPLEPGTRVEARCMLPGHGHVLFHVTGHVAHPDEAAGDADTQHTMVLWLESFPSDIDRFRLIQFLRPELFETEQRAA